jgi:hypothetical protein
MEPAETFEHKRLTVKLYYDSDAGNPREEWDHIGTMVAFSPLWREYHFADRESTSEEDSAQDRGILARWLSFTKGAVMVPFYFADYGSSGQRIYETHEENASGFFYADRDTVVREYGNDSPESRELALTLLRAELREMSQWVEGDVWGYVIETPKGFTDSLWGLFGFEYAKQEAIEAADYIAERALWDGIGTRD